MKFFTKEDAVLLLTGIIILVTAGGLLDTLDAVEAAYVPPTPPVAGYKSLAELTGYTGTGPWEDTLLKGWEDPEEEQKIIAAQVESGYLREDVPLSYDLQLVLHAECDRNGIPYPVALGLIFRESGFHTDCVTGDCYGLCQLHAKYFPGAASYTPEENIAAGLEYLGRCIQKTGSLEAGLTAFHDGHDSGDRKYANWVLEAAKQFEK